MKRIAIVAGEVSGDYLAAGLIRELTRQLPDVTFFGIAGPQMIEAGCEMLYPSEKLAVMGFTEAVGRLREIYAIRRKFRRYCLENPPDLLIGVDAPDFNLSLEEKLRQAGIRTIHYVSPSVWAWRPERIHKIKRAVDRILTLFPFEADFYRQHDVPVSYVGHPLADVIPMQPDREAARQQLGLPQDATVVAVLPGSRKTEVQKVGPIFCEAIAQCHTQQTGLVFAAPMATPAIKAMFSEMLSACVGPDIKVHLYDGQAREVMTAADVVMVASGTATLEALLCKRPMVVAYKMAASTWWYMKRKLIVDRYALPNHLADGDVALELYQQDATPQAIAAEIIRLLNSPEEVSRLQQEFTHIHETLRCNASQRAALSVIEVLQQ
jgi:lipid-A-disaccharide synthase